MVFEATEITLKDGSKAVLRTPEESEASLMLDYAAGCSAESPYLNRTPEEWKDVTVESEVAWIRAHRDTGSMLLTCFQDGKVIGNISVSRTEKRKMAHRGLVGIAVRKAWWNKGVGSALFERIIDEAKKTDLEILDLALYSVNKRAKALYDKFGFVTVGETPYAFKMEDGKYISELLMQKYLKSFD